MKKQSKKFVLAGVVLLAIAGLLALTSCKNDSVPEPPSEADWLQEQKKELEGKTEGTYTITAPSYLTEGGLVDLAKLLDEANVLVDLDLSQATGLTYIAAGAFIRCPTLRSVKLPSSVTEIGKYAFAYTGLTEVTIPASVTEIGPYAFNFCEKLSGVTIPKGVTTIGASAFAYTSLTEVTIPEGVTSIGAHAFAYTGLTKVTIPEGITTIGDSAFSSCEKLSEVTIPEGVTSIGAHAFAYTGLTEVTIPEGVTTIGNNAFSSCENLTSVTFQETDGWHLQDPGTNEIYDDPIDVSKPKDNATNLKDSAGQWYGEHLIRVES